MKVRVRLNTVDQRVFVEWRRWWEFSWYAHRDITYSDDPVLGRRTRQEAESWACKVANELARPSIVYEIET